MCSCSSGIETKINIFLHCANFNTQRQTLFEKIANIAVVICVAIWATFKKKIKKVCLEKIFLDFRKWNFINFFYTLHKTPLGETGCFTSIYYLLAAEVSRIHFQNCSLIAPNCFSLKTLTLYL